MSKKEIFKVMKELIYEYLPELEGRDIVITDSLKSLGANSIDRMDIIVDTMEKISLKVPMVEFGGLKNIEEIIDVMYSKLVGQ
ncbi:acyl carrier protein [Streptococcus mutans]|nr:acyl carrier protein [Streptococcus mutans]EMB61668.1 acyl carrier protein [Streptococcus mutans 1SM1]EMB73246.1 acyl carrier protein [Streptococcus mutans 4VF1]EMC34638.1 acyl carrier protein [Streptococcus mutans NLML1]EMC49209.1 acyl carrier protein [Streptococcus mutans SA38]MCB4995029.1 acyl carrier protein [Streptococcus mutans]